MIIARLERSVKFIHNKNKSKNENETRQIFEEIVESNDLGRMKDFLKTLDSEGVQQVLCWASGLNDLAVLELLFKDKKVNPAHNDNEAIRTASRLNRAKAMARLLREPAVMSSCNTRVILLRAFEYVEKLVKNPITANRVDWPNDSFHMSVKTPEEWQQDLNDHLGLIMLLLQERRVDPSFRDNYPMRWAAKNGFLEIVDLLLRHEKASPVDQGESALYLASQNGHYAVVQRLLQDPRVDPNNERFPPIAAAAHKNHIDVFQLLLDNGADPTANDNEALLRTPSAEIKKCIHQHYARKIIKNLSVAAEEEPFKGVNITNVSPDFLKDHQEAFLQHIRNHCCARGLADNGIVELTNAVIESFPSYQALELSLVGRFEALLDKNEVSDACRITPLIFSYLPDYPKHDPALLEEIEEKIEEKIEERIEEKSIFSCVFL